MTRRGFTVLELTVATLLASLVFLGAMGLFGLMDRSDARQQRRLEDLGELSILHQTIRRAMQTLVAAPTPPELRAQGRDAQGQRAQNAQSPRAGEEDEPPPDDPDNPDAQSQIDLEGRRVVRKPRFLLEPQIVGRAEQDAPRRLEVVLLAQPGPGPEPITPTIRGAFELVPMLDGLGVRWRPIEPPGEPTILATGVMALRWSALAREAVEQRYDPKSGAWRYDIAGVYEGEFPKSLRVELVMMSGATFDWLFELAITSGPEP